MCGLFAIIGNLENKDSEYVSNLAKEALLLSSLRGCEGFGICLDFNNLNDVIQMKQNLKTKGILSNVTKEIVNSLSKKKNLSAIFGQTRLPTIGNINSCKNLVPIKTKNLIGIHNGNIFFDELNFSNLEFLPKSDSKLFYEKLDYLYEKDPNNFELNLIDFINNLKGEINIFFKLIPKNIFFTYSNTGSIHYLNQLDDINGYFILMSEYNFVKQILKKIKPIQKNFYIDNLKNKILKINQDKKFEFLQC